MIDTGVLNHSDLSSRLVGGNASASGYDFITNSTIANDNNGRDSDPSDPGDWNLTASCSVRDSSWHGTHVAGTIGAASNNATGVTGVDWYAKLLTARVLGRCGGYTSDIVDAIAWSAGATVPSAPNNTNPAKVLNMSLGGDGACSTSEQTAINTAVSRGAIVVVAAGNENQNVSNSSPANCNNVLSVAALTQNGNKASFSNYGSLIDIAAPGIDIHSTVDSGSTIPTNSNAYANYQGTSMAAPHVAGVVSLMLAAQPNLTNGTIPTANVSAVIESNLKASARPFPSGSTCTTSLCGAGMLDAYRAVMAVKTAPTAHAGNDQATLIGTTVNLNGSASTNNSYGTTTLSSYTWTQTAGSPVTLTNANSATPSFTAPVANETLTFQLAIKNDVGLTATDAVNIAVSAVKFISKLNVQPNSSIESETITLSGLSGSTPITVSGGAYKIGNNGYTTNQGNVNNGDKITVRHTSANTNNGTTTTTLTIGSITSTFSSTTITGADTDGDGIPNTDDTSPSDAKTATPNSLRGGDIIITAPNNLRNVIVRSDTDADLPTTGKPSSANYTFPDGIIQYEAINVTNGASIAVTLTFPNIVPANSKIYKITGTGGYSEFTNAVISSNQVTLTLTDGGIGDADGIANGIIVDPIAVGIPTSSSSGGSTSVSNGGGGGGGGGGSLNLPTLLGLMLAGILGLRQRHRRNNT